MNTSLLNQFLLDAATQPWDEWWDGTRLIFADWLEMEYGKPDEAAVLRGMVCEVADVIETRTRMVGHIRATAVGFSGWAILRIKTNHEPPQNLEFAIEPRSTLSAELRPQHLFDEFHVSCLLELKEEVRYELIGNSGSWRGTLSLDRAQRRCRRKVLEMFLNLQFSGSVMGGIPRKFAQTVGAVEALRAIFADNSPRWVPFERQPPSTIVPGLALLHTDVFFIHDPSGVTSRDNP